MARKRTIFKLVCCLLGGCLILVAIALVRLKVSRQAALNAEYLVAIPPEVEQVRFQDGKYQRGSSPFQEGFLVAKILNIKRADLNHDGFRDTIVIAATNQGGSGSWISLSGSLGGEEKTILIEPESLGDRVEVRNISIERGSKGKAAVCLDMLVHGPNDARCCPTQKQRACFTLTGKRWILIS